MNAKQSTNPFSPNYVNGSKGATTTAPSKSSKRRRRRANAATRQVQAGLSGFTAPNRVTGTSRRPNIRRTNGSVVITHREFVSDISGSTEFELSQQHTINPGNPVLFPWLSTVAQCFELYHFTKLVMEYKSTSGTAVSGTNPALGTVIMATQYDVLDVPFASKQAMNNYEGAVDGAPYKTFRHDVLQGLRTTRRPHLPLTELYVHDESELPTGADHRFYDIGRFSVGTQGMPAEGNAVGELWADFTVELFKPKITPEDTPAELQLFANMEGITTADGTWYKELGLIATSTLSVAFDTIESEMIVSNSVIGDCFVIVFTAETELAEFGSITTGTFILDGADEMLLWQGDTVAAFSAGTAAGVTYVALGALRTTATPWKFSFGTLAFPVAVSKSLHIMQVNPIIDT